MCHKRQTVGYLTPLPRLVAGWQWYWAVRWCLHDNGPRRPPCWHASPHVVAAAPLIEAVIITTTCCFLQIPLLWILTGTTYLSTDIRPVITSSPSRYIQTKELFSSVANNGHSLLALCIACIQSSQTSWAWRPVPHNTKLLLLRLWWWWWRRQRRWWSNLLHHIRLQRDYSGWSLMLDQCWMMPLFLLLMTTMTTTMTSADIPPRCANVQRGHS